MVAIRNYLEKNITNTLELIISKGLVKIPFFFFNKSNKKITP